MQRPPSIKKTAPQAPVKGILSVNSKGNGFLPYDDNEEDIQIQNQFIATALHGDEVEAEIIGYNQWGRLEAKVTKILKRAKTRFVGAMEKVQGGFMLVPDDTRMYRDIYVLEKDSLGAEAGQKVQVEMIGWDSAAHDPQGKVLQIIGKKGDNDTEIHSIVLERGFEIGFPKEVEDEAHALEKSEKPIPQEEIAKRKDLRGTLTFTIDPVDAKDFDDAISYKELDGGDVEIGVHIADVSHYVRPGTALDREARKRAFSVYLVDRTIPMLPEVLSNDMCSLNPNEDKLAFSAVFVMDAHANVKSRWFGKTIINSDKRFTYENAQETINGGTGQYAHELIALNKLAKVMQTEKAMNGAIEFETDEVKFKLGATGKPIAVYRKERLDTHKLVEEYMLLANKEVAEFIFKATEKRKGSASLYRIHDVPQKEKITELSIFLKALGYDLPVKNGSVSSKDINALLAEIEGKPEASLIKTATIRSMAKAIYSTSNIGHYGLAFEFYTHFTSPIRRYPDLLVHRTLFTHLHNLPIGRDEFVTLEKIAVESSEREVKAAEAERASIKLKQVEYMSERIGETFDGVITGVSEWGIFVEDVETKCEGMVRLREMKDDFYTYNEKAYSISGTKNGKKYSLGDKVKFKVVAADLERRALDYALVI